MKYSNKRSLIYLRRLLRQVIKSWLELLTLHIFIFAFFIYKTFENSEEAAQFGDYLAGFAGSLAFLWLVAGYKLQSKELREQRKELSQQRRALESQTVEFKNMGEFAALEQVSHIIERAINKLQKEPEDINSPVKLLHAAMSPFDQYETIKQSNNPEIVQEAYIEFSKQLTPVKEFLNSTATASKLYLKGVNEVYIDESFESEEFLLENKATIKGIPYISEYFSAIVPVLEFLVVVRPMIQSINFAGLVAAGMTIDSSVNPVDKNRAIDHYEKHDLAIPVIVEIYLKG